MLSSTKIRCYEYSDEGKSITHSFSDKTYKVRSFAVDEEKYQACIDEGPRSRSEKANPELVEDRCYSRSRKSYAWKPGEPQPDNTVPIPEITWWELKRASNGKPCPPWKKDGYEKYSKKRFAKRAKRYGLNIEKVVRRKDLGFEPEGVNQYDLWMQIWDSTMIALGEEPINWKNLREIGIEKLVPVKPSPEKIEQERRRARGESLNPYASKQP
jgi:hypothetical protein